MDIRAIIFDLGGVLLRTADFTPRERLATRLGKNRHELEAFMFGGESGNQAQRGVITIRQHWENLSHELNFSSDEFQAVVDEFFANDVLDVNLVEYVRKLHQKYKTGLLSNGWDESRQVIFEKLKIQDAFDDIVISAEVKLTKPDPRIFQLALQRLGVEPHQAIFIDDWLPNVEGARSVGLNAIHFKSTEQIKSDLEQLLVNHNG